MIHDVFSLSLVSLLLGAVAAALSENTLSTLGLAEHLGATRASDYGLGMRKDRRDVEASRALHIPEGTVWTLNQSLQLVLGGLGGGRWLKKIDRHIQILFIKSHTIE